jgi:flavin-binding protein dodecin
MSCLSREGKTCRPIGLSFGRRAQPLSYLTRAEGKEMTDHVYRLIEVVGSSATSVEDAIQSAVTKASETIRHIRWFQVVETRGQVEDGMVAYYQVTMKIGFSVEDEAASLRP